MSEHRKLTEEEKKQLAVVCARIYVENNLDEYRKIAEKEPELGENTMRADLAKVYLDTLRFYDEHQFLP